MSENKFDFSELNMSEDELFSHVNHDELESEKITAPRYSYWQSVFRVFFRKKINIIVLTILAILLVFTYVYPAVIHYDASVDPYINLMDSAAKHLNPEQAMAKFGKNIHWILGSGASGQSTFDAIWYGSSISVSMALICAAINMFIGVVIGAVWGFSKKFDIIMTEVYNVIANIPYILLISVIVTLAATEIPSYISYEVFLSYIGMGLSDMSLGKLIEVSQNAMQTPGWEIEFWSPVAVASIITVVLYVVGQNLGDASDPRTHM